MSAETTVLFYELKRLVDDNRIIITRSNDNSFYFHEIESGISFDFSIQGQKPAEPDQETLNRLFSLETDVETFKSTVASIESEIIEIREMFSHLQSMIEETRGY